MLRKIFSFIKKIVFYSFFLYGYNLLAEPLKIVIPINIITVLSLSILGMPALIAFIIIHILVF